eukprot:gene10445-1893_t
MPVSLTATATVSITAAQAAPLVAIVKNFVVVLELCSGLGWLTCVSGRASILTQAKAFLATLAEPGRSFATFFGLFFAVVRPLQMVMAVTMWDLLFAFNTHLLVAELSALGSLALFALALVLAVPLHCYFYAMSIWQLAGETSGRPASTQFSAAASDSWTYPWQSQSPQFPPT